MNVAKMSCNAEVSYESSSETSGGICCLCFKIHDLTKNKIDISENIENIYNSCSRHINKENLTNHFFKWSNPDPLPFCRTCCHSVQKIHRLNIKLEHIENRIECFVNSFTKKFLKARNNKKNAKVPDGIDFELDIDSKFQGIAKDPSSQTLTDFPTEIDIDNIPIKQEEETQDEDFSETETANADFNTSLSENDSNDDPDDDPLDENSTLSEIAASTSMGSSSNRKHKRRKREFKIDSDDFTPEKPRRKAAIKAEESFITWSKDLNEEEKTNIDTKKPNRSKQSAIKLKIRSLEKSKVAVGRKKNIGKEKYLKKQVVVKRDKDQLDDSRDDERKYKCTQCDKTYKNNHHLRDHKLTHDKNKRFQCVPCGVSYAYRRNLRQHNILKHNGKMYKDPLKSSKGPSEKKLKADPSKKVDKKFACTLCDKNYKTLQNLREHERTHDKDQRFKCTLCDASYAYIRNLRLHLLKHKDDDKSGTFVVKRSRTAKPSSENEKDGGNAEKDGGNAEKDKTKKRSFVCKICGKTCTTPGQLFYHRQTHKAPEAELKCKLCSKTFKNILNMKKHERVIHQEQNKYLCPVCGKEFRSSTGVKDHYERHNRDETEEREKFECPVCLKVFSTKHSLNRHESRHNTEKKFECNICKKKFFTQFEVKNHLVYHKGERAFMCQECGKSFFTKAKLDAHNRIHTGMLFPCEYCHKGFQTTTHLKQHYRSHNKANEQPKFATVAVAQEIIPQPTYTFACQQCNQFFTSESAIHAHILIAHSQQTFIAEFTTFTS